MSFELIILIIIVILIFIYWINSTNNNVEGFLQTFNGRAAIDDQYFFDKLYDDVVYYPNVFKDDELISTGWVDCLQNCVGNCIEDGMTSNAYCWSF